MRQADRRVGEFDDAAASPPADPAGPQRVYIGGAAVGVVALRLLEVSAVSETGFLQTSTAHIPQQRRMYVVGWAVYALVLLAVVFLVRPHPVRMSAGGATQVGIAAFNPGPVGTAGTTQPKPAPTRPAKKEATDTTRATAVSKDRTQNTDQGSGAAGTQGIGNGSGPVNLGTGAGLTLVTRVTPTYPRVMEQARMPGTVVLEAIIHRDGSIGDITVKSATNGAFAQSAIDAVRRWRYTPIPYEGIVTVTVNFTVPR